MHTAQCPRGFIQWELVEYVGHLEKMAAGYESQFVSHLSLFPKKKNKNILVSDVLYNMIQVRV